MQGWTDNYDKEYDSITNCINMARVSLKRCLSQLLCSIAHVTHRCANMPFSGQDPRSCVLHLCIFMVLDINACAIPCTQEEHRLLRVVERRRLEALLDLSAEVDDLQADLDHVAVKQMALYESLR
jgi:hypothetical protein